MNTLPRKTLIGAFALAASLSAPLAFAQSAEASAQAAPTAETAAQAQTSATSEQSASSTQGTTAATGTTTAPVTSPARKSWSDIDVDKDGKLTKAEAAIVPALGELFDKADGNADGALTGEEYKAYVAKVQGGGKGNDGGK